MKSGTEPGGPSDHTLCFPLKEENAHRINERYDWTKPSIGFDKIEIQKTGVKKPVRTQSKKETLRFVEKTRSNRKIVKHNQTEDKL